MVAQTLASIAIWFTEPATANDRPTLLSKLAILELCGWIECELDEIVRKAAGTRLSDASWVEANIVSVTYGFHYKKHFRPMMVRVVGEIYMRRIEDAYEGTHPGDLDRLKNSLGALWDIRCKLAHAHLGAHVPQQVTYQAPSLSMQAHANIQALLNQYEAVTATVLATI